MLFDIQTLLKNFILSFKIQISNNFFNKDLQNKRERNRTYRTKERYQNQEPRNSTGNKNEDGFRTKNENGTGTQTIHRSTACSLTGTKNQEMVPEPRIEPDQEQYRNQEQCSVLSVHLYPTFTKSFFKSLAVIITMTTCLDEKR